MSLYLVYVCHQSASGSRHVCEQGGQRASGEPAAWRPLSGTRGWLAVKREH